MTPEEELKLIDDAIRAIYSGAQSYRIGSREIRRADLSVLTKRKNELLTQITAANGTHTTVATFVPR